MAMTEDDDDDIATPLVERLFSLGAWLLRLVVWSALVILFFFLWTLFWGFPYGG